MFAESVVEKVFLKEIVIATEINLTVTRFAVVRP